MKEKRADIDRLRRAGLLEQAIDICNNALVEDENCYAAYSERSDLLYALGRHEDAFRDLEKLMEIRPESPSAYYVRARWNLELGNNVKAIDDAGFVIASGDEYFADMAHFFRALAFLNLGDRQAAIEDCSKLPADFEAAVTTPALGWKILTRDQLHGLVIRQE